jgi:catechol-2,3-dioxygenase
MISVTGLNHVVLYVRNLERSVQFYKSIFGFKEVARMHGRMAFLRAAGYTNHYDLGLVALGFHAPTPTPGTISLYHLAWEVKTIEDLAKAAELLQEKSYFRGASDRGVSKPVYGEDPNGLEFEIMWRVPRQEWGEMEHRAIVAPLNLVLGEYRV